MGFAKYLAAFGVSFSAIFAAPFGVGVIAGVNPEQRPKTFEQIVTIEQREFSITRDESVSMEVEFQYQMKKIGYGRETIVNIVRSPSGTYSSDALISNNVIYPGVTVREIRNAPMGDAKIWILDQDWKEISVPQANSFVTYVDMSG